MFSFTKHGKCHGCGKVTACKTPAAAVDEVAVRGLYIVETRQIKVFHVIVKFRNILYLFIVETKTLDLPDDNKEAVFARMISERNNIAASYTAEGEAEAEA